MSDVPVETLSAVKLALAIKTLQNQQPNLELLDSQPIAVVGIGCRFPGKVRSSKDYWRLLRRGENAITEIPAERWQADSYYSADQYAEGKMNTRWGGFIEDFDRFDASFFRISPSEATAMDPQQRLSLEVVWEALWDAGIAPDRLAGTATGVYIGIYGSDQSRSLLEKKEAIGAHTCAGISHSMASGRISFLLNLHGPSVSIDTACSSSLVAVHQACQSIRAGGCRQAIAGGVSLKVRPEHYLCLSKLGMTSPTGTCRTFDAEANGFVPGEGCGIVILKPLIDAIRENCRIYAVIRGTAVNHNGRTNALTAPSGLAQQEVIRSAIKNARIAPSNIAFVETHGTGTALGDPIEAEALAETIGSPRSTSQSCALGSVKTNIGHLEAASGIAGFIKACLALHYGEIPPNLHFQRCNPNLTLDETRFFVPVGTIPWPPSDAGRFAGVSSFGFSGTNAHIILEDAPRVPARPLAEVTAASTAYVLPISAVTSDVCDAFASDWREFFNQEKQDLSLYAVCHTAAVRRSHYRERLAIVSYSAAGMSKLLDDYLVGTAGPSISRGRVRQGTQNIAFVFPRDISRVSQVCKDLRSRFPNFLAFLDECDREIRVCTGWSAKDLIDESESKLEDPIYREPALLAIEVALARLWQSWGVTPAVVVGQGVGEIAAAHIAGALPLGIAVQTATLRGAFQAASINAEKTAIIYREGNLALKQIFSDANNVSIVDLENPQLSIMAGDDAAVDTLVASLRDHRPALRKPSFDCYSLDTQRQVFARDLFGASEKYPRQPEYAAMFSTVTGARITAEEIHADYWAVSATQPGLLKAALEEAAALGPHILLGIGLDCILPESIAACAKACLDHIHTTEVPPGAPDHTTLILSALGRLYVEGAPVKWDKIYSTEIPPVTVPSYPYQKKRYSF